MTFAVVSALGIVLQVDAAGVGPDQKAYPVPADVASSSLPSPDLAAVKAAIALARKGDLAQASDVEESIGDPVSRNELGDHAEWTKLVFVLNIESMHQSPIGSESHSIRFRARQGVRKATLASILRKSRPSVRLNEHLEYPEGHVVFQHACKMGLEGIVSKRLGSRYRSGRSPYWLKFKNPDAPAVKREAEEDWR